MSHRATPEVEFHDAEGVHTSEEESVLELAESVGGEVIRPVSLCRNPGPK